MKRKSVTLEDLSQQTGYSVHTVSKALRGKAGMSSETRKTILLAARQLGYRTREQEESLAVERFPFYSSQHRRFKLIFTGDSVHTPLVQLILNGLQQTLSENGHSVDLLLLPDACREENKFNQWVEQNNVQYTDGIFIAPLMPFHFEELLLQLPLPRILLNFPPTGSEIDSVIWDVGGAIQQSVNYLLQHGHRRILYIGNIHKLRGFRLRWRAFVEAMGEAGISVNEADHMTFYSPKKEWLPQFAAKLEEQAPTALLNSVHLELAWVYHVCSMQGKSIPHDYSFVSLQHDANPFVPQLSRPLLPIEETGRRAAERMLWRIANPSLPYEHIMLQGSFYPGKTVVACRE